MKQTSYTTIIKAIQYGAPAIADELVVDFNQTVQNSNNWIEMKQREEKLKDQAARCQSTAKDTKKQKLEDK